MNQVAERYKMVDGKLVKIASSPVPTTGNRISGYSPSPTQYQNNHPRFNTVHSRSPGISNGTPVRIVRDSQGRIISNSPYNGVSQVKRLSTTASTTYQPRRATPTNNRVIRTSTYNQGLRTSHNVRRRSRSNSQEDLWKTAMTGGGS